MREVDPRLVRALGLQLAQWRATLVQGAERVGWKLGLGDRERLGGELAVGHLTSATRLDPGASYRARGAVSLSADAEIALELGRDIDPEDDADTVQDAIAGFAAALEIVDLGDAPDDPEGVVAGNVFHRAFALGPASPALPATGLQARVLVNDELRGSARAPQDHVDKVRAAARILAAVGERLQAGDRMIMGSIVQVRIEPGDEVVSDLGALGRVNLAVTP